MNGVGPSFQLSEPPDTVGVVGDVRSSLTVVGAVHAEILPAASVAWNSTTVVPAALTCAGQGEPGARHAEPEPLVPSR